MTDPLAKLMKRFGAPLTPENYITLNYMGDKPQLDAESDLWGCANDLSDEDRQRLIDHLIAQWKQPESGPENGTRPDGP